MFPSDRSHVDPFRVMQILGEAQSRIDASALGYTATLGALSFVRRLLTGMLRRIAMH
ncbi:hypothetical protein CIP107506_01959 [Corynebacterium diphtheriae]|nr:hypothetical protein CIP107506_01959 [Corynebacterium diphtheriae]